MPSQHEAGNQPGYSSDLNALIQVNDPHPSKACVLRTCQPPSWLMACQLVQCITVYSDCVHPPGGVLNTPQQQLERFTVYSSPSWPWGGPTKLQCKTTVNTLLYVGAHLRTQHLHVP